MAENTENKSTMDELRAELKSLRGQVENIFKTVSAKGEDAGGDLAARIAHEIENCRKAASVHAGQLRDAGQAGLNEVEEHVRKNPMASLLMAFGVGYIVSCLFRKLR